MNRDTRQRAAAALAAGFVACLALACDNKPKYPACDSDADCKDRGEICIDKQCKECKTDATCAQKLGPGATCVKNSCVAATACVSDGDCPGDQKCQNRHCVKADGSCKVDTDCASGQECFAGLCRAKGKNDAVAASCRDPKNPGRLALTPIPFDYDQAELRPDAQGILERDAECLKQAPAQKFVVEGHCDERGTVEYNLSLGEQRAGGVVKQLERLGVGRERLRTVSKGKADPVCRQASESCYAKNRRVEFK